SSDLSWLQPLDTSSGLTGQNAERARELKHMLKLFNTLTGRQEGFEPIEPKVVRMYVCGVTVYDYCHIGHARSALVFDVLRRYLEYSGYAVTFVKNFTDVDDKIIKRANEQGVSCDAVTTKYIQAYHEDMGKLRIRAATGEPKATEHIADIVQLTERLIKKGWHTWWMGMCILRSRNIRNTEGCQGDDSRTCKPVLVWRWMNENITRWILPCGRTVSRESRHGKAPGGEGDQAGISSAPPCRFGISAKPSTSMAAEWI